jgi:aminoglycoside phosphotransferase (APT) family kinase protein
VWVDGDLHAGNLVVQGAKLSAVIDFGRASLDDPAANLVPARTFLPADHRSALRARASLDEAAWLRGQGWARYAGAIALLIMQATTPLSPRLATRHCRLSSTHTECSSNVPAGSSRKQEQSP